MKTKFSLIAAVLFFAAVVGYGQSFSFRVLANKGDNKVIRNGVTESLKTGASLFSNDQLIASAGAYIGLMHKTGKTTEVKTAGTYNVGDLEKSVNTTVSSSASRYADYVVAKMNTEEGSGSYRQNMAVTGAVERATSSSAIQVMLPGSIDIYNPEAIVRWKAVEGAEGYTVTLKNIFDDEVYTMDTDKTSVQLDFSSAELANEKLVILNVKTTSGEIASGDFGIKRLSPDDAAKIAENVQMLKADLSSESALSYIIEASYYEEQNLLLDALTKYEQAIKLAPEVQDFQDLYQGFILKYNLGG